MKSAQDENASKTFRRKMKFSSFFNEPEIFRLAPTTEYLYFSYNEIFTTLERLTELSCRAHTFLVAF